MLLRQKHIQDTGTEKSHGLSANAHLVKIGIKLTVTYLTYRNKTISGVRNLAFLHSSNISQAITSQAQSVAGSTWQNR